MNERAWELYIPRELVVPLLRKRGFRRILGLTRLVNAMRFAHTALVPVKGHDTPHARRQRTNSFFLTAALLVEGMHLARRLAQDYRDEPAFGSGFGQILKDAEITGFIKKHLKAVRNEAVFHVDDELAGPAEGESGVDLVFMSGIGKKNAESYYDIGDLAAVRVLFGKVDAAVGNQQHMRSIMERTTSLAIAFLTAADLLIGHVAKTEGLKMRLVPPVA